MGWLISEDGLGVSLISEFINWWWLGLLLFWVFLFGCIL